MNAQKFVGNWRSLKTELLASFTDAQAGTEVAAMVQALRLTPAQHTQLRTVLDAALRDTLYTLLLGLDGAASIGGDQQSYTLHDENGQLVAEPGELEMAAWEAFHGEDAA
ncbi:hypothetical protein [Comamonas sp. GB3 AK4-5]|uniref:hypothetical protein n=1 Tax=Comamonas sp. GB3 AK4-5 TaxID=3231487 RepID=UPI00351DE712